MASFGYKEFFDTLVDTIHKPPKSAQFQSRAYLCEKVGCEEMKFLPKKAAIPTHHGKPMRAINDLYLEQDGTLWRYSVKD